MTVRELNFDVLVVYDELWRLGGTIATSTGYGNPSNWLLLYRDGLRGMLARIIEVDRHYAGVVRTLSNPPDNPNEWAVNVDRHTAGLLFGMDSSLECFVFAFNALGYARSPEDFWNIADTKELRRIGPAGYPRPRRPRIPQGRLRQVLPKVQQSWTKNRTLIEAIFEYHDVSKHRAAVVTGGDGTTVNLRADPKSAEHKGSSATYTLQSLSTSYEALVNDLLPLALQDAAGAFGLTAARKS